METIKLLLADDHLLIRNGLKSLLKRSADFEVVAEAINGKEVVEYLTQNPQTVDVVLMDINMPTMSGIEATEIISEKFKNVKVLGLTMHVEEVYISKMIKAGALGYVLKDSNAEDLVFAIKTVSEGDKYYSNEVSVIMINSLMNEESLKGSTPLSTREIEVLGHIAKGYTNKEIGEFLNISSRTVETHRRNIHVKLEVKNTAEMIRVAIQSNLVA